MKIKLLKLCSFSIISSFLFFGCQKQNNNKHTLESNTVSDNSNRITIGFSIDTLAIERWQRDLDVFMNKTKELGANVIVQNAGNNLEEQNRQLLYLMERDVNAIVVLAKKADGLSETIQKIKSKNIPVIAYDRLILDSDIDLYISINSDTVGELMGTGLRSLSTGPKWYCILGAEEDYNMNLIKNGIKKSLRGSGCYIAHTFYADGWNYDLAYQEMVRLISKGEIPDAIVCGNDAVADSVISALNTYYNGPHIPICGQDADIAACQNIVSGKQDFTIYKPITKLAEKAAEYAVNIAKGEDPSAFANNRTINNNYKLVPVVWLEPQLVNTSNIDEVIINSGFHSYNEVYTN